MNAAIRGWARVLSMLRFVPASLWLAVGSIFAAFIVVLAGPAWGPLETLAVLSGYGYGIWRFFRRQRSRRGWKPWKP